MSTTISHAGNITFQGSATADKVTTVNEARQSKAADGSAAPKGTTAVAVQRGDTISQIMAKYGLDWNNPADRAQFLQDNPQFAEVRGGRNPDLIWEGEVVYVHTSKAESPAKSEGSAGTKGAPKNGTVPTGRKNGKGETEFQDYKNGKAAGTAYLAKEKNGQPINHNTVGTDGTTVRTGPDGKPLNGFCNTGKTSRVPKSSEDAREMVTLHQYQNYRNGKPVGPLHWAQEAKNGNPADNKVIGPDGKELRTDSNGEPKNGAVYVGEGEGGKSRYQNYYNGLPVGPEYQAVAGEAGPANAYTLDASGKFVRTGANGRPLDTNPKTAEGRTNAALNAYMRDKHGQAAALPGWSVRTPSPAEKEALRQAIQAEKAAGVSKEALQARYGCDSEISQLINALYG